MSVLIRGGTVVNADQSIRADVACVDGQIVEVGLDLEAQNGHGRTALEAAYNVRYDSIVDFLLENGAEDSLR